MKQASLKGNKMSMPGNKWTGRVHGGSRVLVTLAVLITVILPNGCERKQQTDAPSPAPEVAVVTIQPRPVTLTTELPGRTSAYLVAEIRPQVSGIIQERLFTEGASVEAGQVLYQIAPAPFQAALDQASANLEVARKSADRARATLNSALANVAQQQAVLDLALTDRARFEALAEKGAVSLSDRDKAVTEAKVGQATLNAVKAQVNSNQQAVAEAEAAIKQAEAACEMARINLGYTRITAPIAGRIGRSLVTMGALVTAQQPTALATIQQLDPIYVDAPQSTANMLQLKRNMADGRIKGEGPNQATVKLFFEDGTPYPEDGSLKFSDVTVDASTGSFIFRMVFPNPEQTLMPGMYVRAVIEEGVIEQALLVPQQGISRDRKGNPFALIVDAEGNVEQRPVTLDKAIGDKWLVVAGLNPGDQVIVEGSLNAKPGTSVRVVPLKTGKKDSLMTGQTPQPTTTN